ncbi:hypothetical protein AB6A40_011059, partial [Gnathostoma spinigerum]
VQWMFISEHLSACEEEDACPKMNVPGGHVRYTPSNKPLVDGSLAELVCTRGMATDATPQVVCLDGTWHPDTLGPCNE